MNMKLNKLFLLFLAAIVVSCTGGEKAAKEEMAEDTPEVAAEEWINLFDGETLDGWKRYNADEIGPLWTVEDGTIKCDGTGLGEGSGEFRMPFD